MRLHSGQYIVVSCSVILPRGGTMQPTQCIVVLNCKLCTPIITDKTFSTNSPLPIFHRYMNLPWRRLPHTGTLVSPAPPSFQVETPYSRHERSYGASLRVSPVSVVFTCPTTVPVQSSVMYTAYWMMRGFIWKISW